MRLFASIECDDMTPEDFHSYDFRGWPARSFTTLFAAGEEAGISRLYGGIHYLNSVNQGLASAKQIGNSVGSIKLH